MWILCVTQNTMLLTQYSNKRKHRMHRAQRIFQLVCHLEGIYPLSFCSLGLPPSRRIQYCLRIWLELSILRQGFSNWSLGTPALRTSVVRGIEYELKLCSAVSAYSSRKCSCAVVELQ